MSCTITMNRNQVNFTFSSQVLFGLLRLDALP